MIVYLFWPYGISDVVLLYIEQYAFFNANQLHWDFAITCDE